MTLAEVIEGYIAVSLVNPKLENVYQVIRVYQHFGMKLTKTEIASLAGVSESYMRNPDIKRYLNETNCASDDDIKSVVKRFINVSVSKADSIEEALGAILGINLKIYTDIFRNVDGLKEASKLGTDIVSLYRICSYKTDGVPVHSGNKSVESMLCSQFGEHIGYLFTRSNSYRVGAYSKKWQPTSMLTDCIGVALDTFFGLLPVVPVCHLIPPLYMFLKKDAKHYVDCDMDIVRTFEINSVFHLLMSTVEIVGNSLRVVIQNESSTDESLGRSYNVFSKIRSRERLQLGYISYDPFRYS
jgi:hypothetical protein